MTAGRQPRTLDELAGQRDHVGDPVERPGEWRTTPVLRQYSTTDNPQFSILELMLITGICAVTITVIRAASVFGILGLFVVCFFTWLHLRCSLTDPTKLRFWSQFIWGILMPIGCIFGDPFVFGRFEMGKARAFNEYAFACYAFIGWEIFCMTVSCFVKPTKWRLNLLLAGSLLAGAVFAYLIAFAILPMTLFGLIIVIGVIGFTPWFTGNVYGHTALMHWRRGKTAGRQDDAIWYVLIGFLFSIFIGGIIYVLTLPMLMSQPNQDTFFGLT